MLDISSKSVQEWLPFERVLENGIIRMKNNSYVKIIKVIPINFNLKTELEKQSILNSYKIFLKTCNFDTQILIQSNKEDLSKSISNIQKQIEIEHNKNIIEISKKYIEYIKSINLQKKSSSKSFYILIKKSNKNTQNNNSEEFIIENLNENYFKIKECLSRCGNIVFECNKKDEVEKIIFSFLNSRKYFNQI